MSDDTANIRANELVDREQAWWMKYFVAPARDAVARRSRFSIRKAAEIARNKDFTGVDGKTVKLSNNLIPCLARRLVRDVPELAPYIELRHSKWD